MSQARTPVNGKLPIGPIPISPDMLSPATLPVNSSVSGIGLVMETFQATLSPLAVPSKISAELPSAAWMAVSVPPDVCSESVAFPSPIGVLMVIFQSPSTAIRKLLLCVPMFCQQGKKGYPLRYSPYRRTGNRSSGRTDPVTVKTVGHAVAELDQRDRTRGDIG